MPRAQSDEQLVLAGLRKAVREGRAGAANDLARFLARRDRAKNPTPTELRAMARDQKRKATSESRSIELKGPSLGQDMSERTMHWLLQSDDEQDPHETERIRDAHERFGRAQDQYVEALERSPQQDAMNAEQRDVQAWYRRMRAAADNKQETP